MKRNLFTGTLVLLLVAAALGGVAMHISEGFLPLGWCIAWGVICLPFLIYGLRSIASKTRADNRLKMLLALSGAFAFMLSALKIPSVTGSCSHMTGMGLGAVLFGGGASAVLGLIVLLFQAILLAHGGLSTLGANVFSMAVAGPLMTAVLWRLLRKTGINKSVSAGIAAGAGDLFTYLITTVQLSLAFPAEAGGFGASLVKFGSVFVLTQAPLAIIEGILTGLVFAFLQSYCRNELQDLHVFETADANKDQKKVRGTAA